MRRTAMAPGAGFRRPVFIRQPLPAPTPITRGVVVSCAAMSMAQPKTAPRRRPSLLEIAEGKYCLLKVRGVCLGPLSSTVACHSNLSIHGKAGARKADDCYSVWGCAACHRWLDQGPAAAKVKEPVFILAHLQQIMEWRRLATGPAGKEQCAAAWALQALGATPAVSLAFDADAAPRARHR